MGNPARPNGLGRDFSAGKQPYGEPIFGSRPNANPAAVAPGSPILPPRDALARAGPVGESRVAGAIGQAFDRRVAAKAEIREPRGRDRPAAALLAQFEQRAAMFARDRLVIRF